MLSDAIALVLALASLTPALPAAQSAINNPQSAVGNPQSAVRNPQAALTGPVVVVDTSKGTFAFETFPNDAPKTVAHILDLVRRGFYDGQRIHRALPGFVVQWGDPQSRDPDRQAEWGKGAAASSGTPIGVSEITKKRQHTKGAVGVAHMGIPTQADSQIYVTLADRPDLNGKYTVFGHIIDGDEVLEKLQVGDVIRKAYVRD